MSEHRKNQRINSVFAAKEWSDRDPNFAWYQLGGLHFAPLTGKAHQAKVQVTHATQQRFYAAVNYFLDAETGFDEAVSLLLDAAKVGLLLKRNNPAFYADRLKNSKLLAQAATAEELVLASFPGSKTDVV